MDLLEVDYSVHATKQQRAKPSDALLKAKRENELYKIREDAAIQYARDEFASEGVEIDEKPKTSRAESELGEGGTWVAAWLWVSDADIEDKVTEAKSKHRLFKRDK